MLRIALGILLAICLTACSLMAEGPPKTVVKSAVALQFSQTQQEILQLLTPNANKTPDFTISQVKITQQTPISIMDIPAYRVEGTFNLKLNLTTRQISDPNTPFEVYLQSEPGSGTWRLARPLTDKQTTESTWVTYLVESPT